MIPFIIFKVNDFLGIIFFLKWTFTVIILYNIYVFQIISMCLDFKWNSSKIKHIYEEIESMDLFQRLFGYNTNGICIIVDKR